MTGIIVTTMGMESGGVGSGLTQVEIEVDPKTVGQFTGLLDKAGKEIYEGDILEGWCNSHQLRGYVYWGNCNFRIYEMMRLRDGEWKQYADMPKEEEENVYGMQIDYHNEGQSGYKIIGNIYEDKELLEEKP